jgi:omega-6 fatty acid desaturase (delta-12 desaturase)
MEQPPHRNQPNRSEGAASKNAPNSNSVESADARTLHEHKGWHYVNSQSWSLRLAKYRLPDNLHGLREVAVTSICFATLWTATLLIAVYTSYWLALLAAIPAAGFLVRLFLIQHDCGHGTLFTRRAVNDWVGRVLGVLTLTPYDYWRNSHARHHASSGNLDRRGIGDIELRTVREYAALGPWGRLRYRLYRHPLVMFGLGPTFLFVLQHRLPIWALRKDMTAWISTLATNLGIAFLIGLMAATFGWEMLLKVHAPITIVAASTGVWLFYVQHQFEETFWARASDWSPHSAALQGSSYYDLPRPLRWLTANIGLHHLHHLSSKIPFYRLPAVLKEWPELKQAHRLTMRESINCVKLTLWDEDSGRLVSFKHARAGLLRMNANVS